MLNVYNNSQMLYNIVYHNAVGLFARDIPQDEQSRKISFITPRKAKKKINVLFCKDFPNGHSPKFDSGALLI